MKLKSFRVREFRSVWDSGDIDVDDLQTCLVGKNEAGKTSLLTALYRTNPVIPSDAKFSLTIDYPKREVETYRFAVEDEERDEAVVVECLYEIEAQDLTMIDFYFGKGVLVAGQTFKRKTYYGKANSRFDLDLDHVGAFENVKEKLAADVEDGAIDFASLEKWSDLNDVLDEIPDTATNKGLKVNVKAICKDGFASHVFNAHLWKKAPKFLYFDEYYQMSGRENLDSLIEREDAEELEPSDYPLLGLIRLARMDHRQLVEAKNTEELKNKLQGASNHLTRQIVDYWSQNQHIQMRFDVRDAKPEDPEGMQSGVNIWGEVYDQVHWATTSLGSRSRGFVWFFSFLAWYEDIKRQKQNVILLLDEPGLSLHGKAQGDLLRYFDEKLTKHQVIYSTHSPFMVNPNHFGRVRIVQDAGIDTKEILPKDQDGTKVLKDVFDASEDSLFPLQGALGYEIQQTLFIAPNSLVVEGPADLLFLSAISAEFEREGRTPLSDKWVITPVGGSGKVPTFVAMMGSQKGINVATLLDVQDSDREKIEGLYKDKLLKKQNVLTYADFLDQNEADVEDMFDRSFYLKLVNGEFKGQLAAPIKVTDLNKHQPRTLRAIEDHLANAPMTSGKFGHYRPARYFTENIAKLWKNVSDDTKDRFEAGFKALNRLLK